MMFCYCEVDINVAFGIGSPGQFGNLSCVWIAPALFLETFSLTQVLHPVKRNASVESIQCGTHSLE
jgi:hypothetical protein